MQARERDPRRGLGEIKNTDRIKKGGKESETGERVLQRRGEKVAQPTRGDREDQGVNRSMRAESHRQ